MKFTETRLKGAYIIEPERDEDERGFFARLYCSEEFARHGIRFNPVQCSISFNKKRGTLRGMHYQAAPHAEAKLVRCTMGAIYDVIVDLRLESPTYGQWISVELTSENRLTLYVPEGFAHGFQTLTDGAEIYYQMSKPYAPQAVLGFRWNDPTVGIKWPYPHPTVISAKDNALADLPRSTRV